MNGRQLKEKLKGALAELPVLPQAVVALMQLDPTSATYYDDVFDVVASEPNFATRLMMMANSAASGAQEPIDTLEIAFARVGSGGAADLVTSLSVTRVFVPRDDWEKSIWRHAIQVAVASRELARRCNDREVSPGAAYVCGLLHDVGRFVMLQEAPDILRQVDEGDWTNPDALVAAEMSICGVTHSELGAQACERWNLPATICATIREHHAPRVEAPVGTVQKLRAIITSADIAMFPSAVPGAESLESASLLAVREIASDKLPTLLRLSVPELKDVLALVFRESSAMTSALGLD